MTQASAVDTALCFLCNPRSSWIWAESEHFFAMAALGPIVPGMSLIASREHARSMFDIPDSRTAELTAFTHDACSRLTLIFGTPVQITEHGRVGLCETRDAFEQHCYHAHRLLFPTEVDLGPPLEACGGRLARSSSFVEARDHAASLIAYLYYERPDRSVLVRGDNSSIPRQFFRGAVAKAVGHPELRSWRAHPNPQRVEAAAVRLRRT